MSYESVSWSESVITGSKDGGVMEVHRHLNKIVRCYVTEEYGDDVSINIQTKILELEDSNQHGKTPHWLDLTLQASSECLGVDTDTLARDIGFSYVEQMIDRSPFQKHLLNLGNNFVEFINNLDSIHSFIAQKSKSVMHVPSFTCLDGLGGAMELVYISPRCCYNANLVEGMMKAISNLIFQAPMTCVLREEKTIELGENAGKDERVRALYDLNLQAMKDSEPLIIPTMLAERSKHAEHKISQSNVDEVNEEIAHILLTEGPEGHPLRKAARHKARLRWKKLGDVIRGAAFFKFLASKFQPVIPAKVDISGRDFCSLLAFHIIINKESKILQAGIAIQRQVPALKNVGEELSTAVTSVYPPNIKLSYQVLSDLMNTTFILSGEYHRKDRQSQFKGHFVQLSEPRRLMFVGSPYVRNVDECCEAGIKISQISEYDVTREFILSGSWNIQKTDLPSVDYSKARISRTRAIGIAPSILKGDRSGGHTNTSTGDTEQARELQMLRDQLSHCKAQLGALKDRYRQLYLGMIPASVVNTLQDQARLWLLPNEKSILGVFAGEEDGSDKQVKSLIQATAGGSQSTPSVCVTSSMAPVASGYGRKSGTPNMTSKGKKNVDLEKGETDLHRLTNQKAYGDRGTNSNNPNGMPANESVADGINHPRPPHDWRSTRFDVATDKGAPSGRRGMSRSRLHQVMRPNYMEYKDVSILFCDIVNFTKHSDMDRALTQLSVAYRWLVRLCQVFHLEIVESVGDAFLLISDVSCKSKSQAARNMADCALAYLILSKKEFPMLQLRIGIHHGTVQGGVVQRNHKTFLIWGEDVEYACKMEAFGLPDKIQISQQFFRYVNDGSFNFEQRDNLVIKGHDPTNCLFLLSSKVWSQNDLEHIFAAGLE